MADTRAQVVTGLTPPQLGEAKIREVWPSVARHPGLAGLGRVLTCSIIGAPLAWLLLALLYFGKLAPFRATRYTLTNRRLMIQHGLRPAPAHEVPLADIDDVVVKEDANSDFYRAGTLEVMSKGQVVLTLPGVPEPKSFRENVLNACRAWVPGKSAGVFIPAKAPSA